MAAAFASTLALLPLLCPSPAAAAAAADPSSLARSLLSAAAPPIVLPLLRSFPNSSGRELARSSSISGARMRLYDNLLTNGYYSTRLYIGTPPQRFALIVDSGSSVTYVPCSTCEKCGVHQDPRFRPDSSTSYKPVKCNGKIQCNCGAENQCVYKRQYAEMSTSSGVLGEDLVSFGNESNLMPHRVVFGCENAETGDLYTQRADGIMGLGRGQLSIMDQLVEMGVINDSFSLCYGGMDVGGGAMVLGEIPTPPGMVFSYSNPIRSPYYNLDLKDIQVSGEPLHLNPRIFDRKHGTILDSGTTYAYLPEVAFDAIKDAIMKQIHSLKQIPGPDTKYNDFCFSGAGRDASELAKDFPEVDMVFGNGQKITLSPENYLFRHAKVHGAYCLGFFKTERDRTTLLGGVIVRNTLVTYDRKNNRIGFLKTNCSELWERLHLVDAPPSSSPSPPSSPPTPSSPYSPKTHGNASGVLSPAPSTGSGGGGSQSQFQKGAILIGFLTFDLYLSVDHSTLVPLLSELTVLLANELEVNASRIHLLHSTSMGNGSLVSLAIYPAGSDSFSNITAMAIISRLQEHHIHLPPNFGSYELRAWEIEKLQPRTWWQRHMLAIFLGGLVLAVLSSSAFLVLYLHKRKHQWNAYRPVDAPGPEQELQPL